MTTNNSQLSPGLKHIHMLMESLAFTKESPEDGPWKIAFAELILLLNDRLIQEDRAGQRVDFWEGVGVQGKLQDVTSLVAWLRACFPDTLPDFTTTFASDRLNRYFGKGTGYFANGAFFTCEQADDLAFFVDDQRIYLKCQIGRAVTEIETHAQAVH
ncbi:hypothetical protein [Spirosoma aerophilum]